MRDFKNFNRWMFSPLIGDDIDNFPDIPIRNFMYQSDVEVKSKIFPPNFMIGTASSAYQVEGGWDEDGKTPSIWDDFVHFHKNSVADKSTGDIGPDSFHCVDDDIDALKLVGVSIFFYLYFI